MDMGRDDRPDDPACDESEEDGCGRRPAFSNLFAAALAAKTVLLVGVDRLEDRRHGLETVTGSLQP